MKLQNILWVPVVAIGFSVASLASLVTAQPQAQNTQVNADQSQPRMAGAVHTSDNKEGANVAAMGCGSIPEHSR